VDTIGSECVALIRSIFSLMVAALATAASAVANLPPLLVDRRGLVLHYGAKIWSWLVLASAGVSRRVEGRERLDPRGTYLFVSNHQSLYDIPVLYLSLPQRLVFAAKKELFRIPFFGWVLKLAGFPPVDRGRPDRAREQLSRSARALRARGTSVVVFPEGTRSPDGTLRPFKRGAFFMARDLGAAIVPVAIAGTHAIVAKHSLRIRPGRVRVLIGEPVEVLGRDAGERRAVMDLLRERIQGLLEGAGEAAPSAPRASDRSSETSA
jgi:1-acyl-sn-glycerol-3-phosphate acyltransferase